MQTIRKGVLRNSLNGSYLLNALRQGLSQGCGGQDDQRGGDGDEFFQVHALYLSVSGPDYNQRGCRQAR